MNEDLIKSVKDHAAKEFGDGKNPKESCGVIVVKKGKKVYVPCRNVCGSPGEQFIMSPEDYAAAEDMGEIVCIVHSHPYHPAKPSEADLIGCEKSGRPWMIVSWPSGEMYEFEPSGYKMPLIGRKFVHGISDCYSLIRDYYMEVLGVELPDFERDADWWHKGFNLYDDNYGKAGFVVVPDGLDDLQVHDVVFMQISSPVVNHAGVYIGDNVILHHFHNRLSSREVFGSSLRRCTVKVVRYVGGHNA